MIKAAAAEYKDKGFKYTFPAVFEYLGIRTNSFKVLLCRRTEGGRHCYLQGQWRCTWEAHLGADRVKYAGPVVADIREGHWIQEL